MAAGAWTSESRSVISTKYATWWRWAIITLAAVTVRTLPTPYWRGSLQALTAMLTEPRLFQTGSIPMPASRFLCEHLHQNVFFWACISRIHAQVPVVTTGQLAKTFRQQIPCGIDVAVVASPAFRARPVSLIKPQYIEPVLAFGARLARGIPAIHRLQDLAVPAALVRELAAHLAERDVVDRTGVQPARHRLHVQVLYANEIKLAHQPGRECVQGALALLSHPSMRPCHPQPLLLTASAAFLPPCKTPLLLTQVLQACVIGFRIGDFLPRRESGQMRQTQVHAHHAMRDSHPGRLHLCAETDVVVPRGIARQCHQVRPRDLGKRFGELERTELRQTQTPACPSRPYALKPQA